MKTTSPTLKTYCLERQERSPSRLGTTRFGLRAAVAGRGRQGLRGGGVLLALLAACAAFGPTSAVASARVSTFDMTVLTDLNQIRATHGLPSLVVSAPLAATASRHSRAMLADGYFSHGSAGGATFRLRIVADDRAPLDGNALGENLFWGLSPVTPAAAVRAWMESPLHRANILDPKWREIGIAAVTSTDAPGVFAHLGVTVITVDFETAASEA